MSTTCPPLTAPESAPLTWGTEMMTAQAAQALAAVPAIASAVIELHGDLGAGKTTFARYLLQALGITGRIKSPTYAVVECYEGVHPPCAVSSMTSIISAASPLRFAIWHFDFYRFNDPQEWEDAGFRDIFASPGLKLIEWPEQAGDLLPLADLKIFITLDTLNNSRQVRIEAPTTAGQSILAQWLKAVSL